MTASPIPVEAPRYGWIDDQFLPWEQCRLHVRNQGAFIGANVFEGIRGYWNDEHRELYLFRLQEHLERFRRSAKIARIAVPYSLDKITGVCGELVRRNAFDQGVHLIVAAYVGVAPDFIMLTPTDEVVVAVTAVTRPRRPMATRGIRCEVSSWLRISEAAMPPRVKAGGNYFHNRLAYMDAKAKGFDNAILLDEHGHVTESTGACLFMVSDGRLHTPLTTDRILESITRRTVIRLARDLDLEVRERHIGRTELYVSDEVFLCGSGAEVIPVTSIDGIEIGTGAPGPVTARLRDRYFATVEGRVDAYAGWLTPAYGAAVA